MKLTNIQMSNYMSALNKVAQSDKVSGKLAYAIARNMRKISEEGIEYDMLRRKIVEKYGEKTDEGFAISPDSPDYEKALQEINEIGNITHDVDIFKVSEDLICNSMLNVQDILSIDFMIEEPTE